MGVWYEYGEELPVLPLARDLDALPVSKTGLSLSALQSIYRVEDTDLEPMGKELHTVEYKLNILGMDKNIVWHVQKCQSRVRCFQGSVRTYHLGSLSSP